MTHALGTTLVLHNRCAVMELGNHSCLATRGPGFDSHRSQHFFSKYLICFVYRTFPKKCDVIPNICDVFLLYVRRRQFLVPSLRHKTTTEFCKMGHIMLSH
ncbi:unnamed protein product [Ixodes persulcatus]